jgi:hypothetical protein
MGTVACAPSPFCLPDEVCARADGCKTPDPMCLDGQLANLPITRLDCAIPTDMGQPCPSTSTATVDFGMAFGPAMAQCTDVGFYTVFSGAGQLQFEPTLRFADGVEVLPSPPAAPCTFDITWANSQVAALPMSDRGLMQLTIDNGEHIIIPVHVQYLPGCTGAPMTCTPFFGSGTSGMTDTVWSCLDF